MPKTPKAEISEELLALVRDLIKQQADVLKVAMETQRAQAEVLNKWMGMFTPQQSAPNKSTTVDERALLKAEMGLAEWDPLDPDIVDFPS